MSYPIILGSQAVEDMRQAVAWYEDSRPGLGDEFIDEVAATLERISESPLVFRKVHGDTRRAILRRFPYGVYFRLLDEKVLVQAVFHGRRDPRRWQSR